MRTAIRDSKQIVALVKNFGFSESAIGNFAFISDEIKVPLFVFDHSGMFEKNEVIQHNQRLISIFCEAVSSGFDSLMNEGSYVVRDFGMELDQVKENYMDLVMHSCERNGKYSHHYDLMYQLTHYVTTFAIKLRVGLEKDPNNDEYLIPVFVATLVLEANNKFDKGLDKVLELELIKLND